MSLKTDKSKLVFLASMFFVFFILVLAIVILTKLIKKLRKRRRQAKKLPKLNAKQNIIKMSRENIPPLDLDFLKAKDTNNQQNTSHGDIVIIDSARKGVFTDFISKDEFSKVYKQNKENIKANATKRNELIDNSFGEHSINKENFGMRYNEFNDTSDDEMQREYVHSD